MKHDEFKDRIDQEDDNLIVFKAENEQLVQQMQEISVHLDELIDDCSKKEESLRNKQVIVRNKKCDHGPKLNNLRQELANRDGDISYYQEKIATFVTGSKEEEVAKLKKRYRLEVQILKRL
jgi:negative regulator of sigma E activity